VFTLVGLSLSLTLGCGDSAGPASSHGGAGGVDGLATSVQVSPPSFSLEEGASATLTCAAKDWRGALLSTAGSWAASDTTIATVDPNGVVVGHRAGNATATCSISGKSATAAITVTPSPIAFVEVSPGAGTLVVGKSIQLSGVPRDSLGVVVPGHAVQWTSGDTSVATVSPTGTVIARVAGAADVIAVSGGKAGMAKIKVGTTVPVPVATVLLSLDDSSIAAGKFTHATATTLDASGQLLTGRSILWSVGDAHVLSAASVNATKASVTGLAPGITWVMATSEGQSATATVVVGPGAVQTVAVVLSAPNLFPGQTTQATATLFDAMGNLLTNRTISWSSLDPSIATVSASGVVTAIAPGAVIIRATSEGKTGDATLTVGVPAVATVTTTLAASTLAPGQTTTATAVLKDAYGNTISGKSVSWSSLNTGVATVSTSGVVTAIAAGSATIRATAETKTGDATLTVTTVPTTVASVVVTVGATSLIPGQTTQATAVAYDAKGNVVTGKTPNWSSQNATVVTVSSAGVVTAAASGSAAVQATVDGLAGTAPLTVVSSTTSAPAVDAEPTFNSTTGTLVYADSIDRYVSVDSMWASKSTAPRIYPPYGAEPGDQLVSPGHGGAGKALRMAYAGTYQEGHDWDVVNAPVLPDTTTHFFQYWARVSSGAYPIFKWFMAWHRDGTRVQWNTHDHLPCPTASPAQYGGTVWQVYDQAATTCQANQPVGPYPVLGAWDGQWHRFTYQYRPNTFKGARDGIARMWIDGVKMIDVSAAAVGVTPSGGYKTWCEWDDVDALSTQGVVSLRWGSTMTNSTTAPFTVDVDDVLWWR
jgi:uncharacterized protein YjdB